MPIGPRLCCTARGDAHAVKQDNAAARYVFIRLSATYSRSQTRHSNHSRFVRCSRITSQATCRANYEQSFHCCSMRSHLIVRAKTKGICADLVIDTGRQSCYYFRMTEITRILNLIQHGDRERHSLTMTLDFWFSASETQFQP